MENINLDFNNKTKIDDFVEKYIYKLKKNDSKIIGNDLDRLFYFSEIIGTKYEDDDILNISNEIIKKHIELIHSGLINFHGMFSKGGLFTFIINSIYQKTGELGNLSDKLNEFLLFNLRNKNLNSFPTLFGKYDLIHGISGILYYFLDFPKYFEDIKPLINYLCWLTNSHTYNGKKVINFHVEKEQQFRDDEKERFPDGHINFGLAHGMMGTLIALTKAYENGFKTSNVKNSIIKILDIYKIYEIKCDNGILIYPTQLSFSEFINKRWDVSYVNNASWCYGNISNVYGIMRASKALEDNKKYDYYKNSLMDIFNQNIEKYNLSSTSLCHGYASVISHQISRYYETNIEDFLKTMNRNIEYLFDKYEKYNIYYVKKYDGFKNIKEIPIKVEGYENDISFLTGSGGIFLTLLNIDNRELNYNKILLLR